MAGTSVNVTVNNKKKFSYKAMQELVGYLGTFNCESQVVAIDSSTEDIKTTGTKAALLNGQPIIVAADTDFDLGTEHDEEDLTAWATSTAYTLGKIRSHLGIRIRCIQAHTSSTATKPFASDSWEQYWEVAPHDAESAVGASITKAYEQWFLVTAEDDGTLGVWQAGPEVKSTTGAECKIPQYDYKKYIPIGLLHVKNATGSPFVMGTTGLDTASVTDTFVQLTGPVLPHPDNWDVN